MNSALNALSTIEPYAAEQLDLLSVHPRWWARLYAAQVLREHSGFREPRGTGRSRAGAPARNVSSSARTTP